MRLPDDSPSATVWAAARQGELFCLLCTLTASDCVALNGAAKVLAWGELVEDSFPRPIGDRRRGLSLAVAAQLPCPNAR